MDNTTNVRLTAPVGAAPSGGSSDDLPCGKTMPSSSARERFRSLVFEQRAVQEEKPRNAGPELPDGGVQPFHAGYVSMPVGTEVARSQTPEPPIDELTVLMQRVCSAIYVGAPSAGSARVLLTLDGALAGVVADLVREGVFLRIRLHTKSDATYHAMSARREQLSRALDSGAGVRVEIEVIRDADAGDGRTY